MKSNENYTFFWLTCDKSLREMRSMMTWIKGCIPILENKNNWSLSWQFFYDFIEWNVVKEVVVSCVVAYIKNPFGIIKRKCLKKVWLANRILFLFRLKDIGDKINKHGNFVSPVFESLRSSVKEIVFGPSHIGILLEDGRAYRVQYSINSDRLEFNKTDSTSKK